MPLYLDVHNKVDGLSTQMAAEAHKKDLAVQGKYGVNYIRYWYDGGHRKGVLSRPGPQQGSGGGRAPRIPRRHGRRHHRSERRLVEISVAFAGGGREPRGSMAGRHALPPVPAG